MRSTKHYGCNKTCKSPRNQRDQRERTRMSDSGAGVYTDAGAIAGGLIAVALAIVKVCSGKGLYCRSPCGSTHDCIFDLNDGRPTVDGTSPPATTPEDDAIDRASNQGSNQGSPAGTPGSVERRRRLLEAAQVNLDALEEGDCSPVGAQESPPQPAPRHHHHHHHHGRHSRSPLPRKVFRNLKNAI